MIHLKNKVLLLAGFVFLGLIPYLNGQDENEKDHWLQIYKYHYPTNDSAEYALLFELSYILSPDSCLIFAEKIISKATREKNQKWNYKGYLHKGIALMHQGKLDQACKAYFISAEYAKTANYQRGIGNAYLSLGNTYYSLGNHSNAISYYTKALKIFRTLNDSSSLAAILLNVGTEYQKICSLDTALVLLKEAQFIYKKLGDEKGIAYCIGNIGIVFRDRGELAFAEQNILLALKMLSTLGDKFCESSYSIILAEIDLKKKQYRKAEFYDNKALNIARINGFKVQVRDAYENLALVLAASKDFEKAYKYHILFIAYRDSINNNEATQKIADLRTTYEVAQKQVEIDLLTKRKNIQYIIAFALGCLLFISGIFVFFLYRNIRKTHALNLLLKEQKEELQAQHEQLEGLNKTKDRFFSIISHDLRGPIGSIGCLPELFKEYIAMNEIHEISELVVSMDTSVRRVSTLLDNLLEWALSQQGTFPYHPEQISLNRVMEDVFSVFSTMAEAKGLALKEEIHEEIDVVADRNSLMTIFRNLLSNSIKFCNKGDTITLSAGLFGEMAVISIEDTGVGMSPGKLETLFQLSEKKSTWGTENEKGLGIGLSLVHEFVLMNNGTIEVTSQEGKGSCFIVKIPRLSGPVRVV